MPSYRIKIAQVSEDQLSLRAESNADRVSVRRVVCACHIHVCIELGEEKGGKVLQSHQGYSSRLASKKPSSLGSKSCLSSLSCESSRPKPAQTKISCVEQAGNRRKLQSFAENRGFSWKAQGNTDLGPSPSGRSPMRGPLLQTEDVAPRLLRAFSTGQLRNQSAAFSADLV